MKRYEQIELVILKRLLTLQDGWPVFWGSFEGAVRDMVPDVAQNESFDALQRLLQQDIVRAQKFMGAGWWRYDPSSLSSDQDREFFYRGEFQLYRTPLTRVYRENLEDAANSHPAAPETTQRFFPPSSQHDAYIAMRAIVELATGEVLIADNFVNRDLWSLLRNLKAACTIRILSKRFDEDFALEGRKFKEQYRHVVELRMTTDIHDRFLIVDDRAWTLGASLKDAGMKAAVLSELGGEALVQARRIIECQWSNATVVPIV